MEEKSEATPLLARQHSTLSNGSAFSEDAQSKEHGQLHDKQGCLINHLNAKKNPNSQPGTSIQAGRKEGEYVQGDSAGQERHLEENSLRLAGKPYKPYLCSALGKLCSRKDWRIWIRASFPVTRFLLISWL